MDAALEWKVGRWRAQGISEPEIRDQIRVFRHVNSPQSLLLSLVGGMSIMGAIFSYGITLYLRQRAAAGDRPRSNGKFAPP